MSRQAVVRAALVLAVLSASLPAGLAQPGDAPGPLAEFAFAPAEPVAREVVRFTSLAHGDAPIVAYRWIFGDGADTGVSLAREAEHAFASAGTYAVTHTATDALGRTASVTRAIVVHNAAPVAAIHASANATHRGETIVFSDASTDRDGDAIVAWDWSFGDGAVAQGAATVAHAYAALGDHAVRLVVTDAAGQQASAEMLVRVANAPPVVSASLTPAEPVVGQTVTFTATGIDPDGDASQLSYAWTFSDGAQATGASVQRVFGARGAYEATLHAQDAEGARSEAATLAFRVDAPRPTAAFTVSPAVPVVGQAALFQDASTSPNGPIRSWAWSFGDGATSARQSETHVYQAGGTMAVTLTVVDAQNQSSRVTQLVRVNAPPHPAFATSPEGPVAVGAPLTFTDLSTDEEGPIVSRRWSFGDGAGSAARDPVHAYAAPGDYAVQLEVVDSDGASAFHVRYVRVVNERPVARFAHSPAAPVAGEPVQFTSLSFDPEGAPIASWSWSFGDGAVSTLENPSHTYARSGRHFVTLRVSDGSAENRTQGSVDVGAGHALPVRIAAALPDGRAVDLSEPAIELRVAHVRGDARTDVPVWAAGPEASAQMPVGAWMQGDELRVSLRDARYMDAPLERVLVLLDAQREASAAFVLPMPLVARLEVDAGERAPLGLGAERAEDGTPIYRDPTETFHGAGRVAFLDGHPAAGATVTIRVRPAAGGLAWCDAAMAVVDEGGRFQWRIERNPPCLGGDALAPGRYEAQAVADHAGGVGARSAAEPILVDPSGTGAAGAARA